MEIQLLSLYVFVLGLFFGSFLLVVADRSVRHKSFLFGRSQCDNCSHTLSWKELIPVFSFVLQQGKCVHCHTRLPLLYPISEILTGVVLAITVQHFLSSSPVVIGAALIIVSCLLLIVFADLMYEIIPLPAVILGTLATLMMLGIASPDQIISHLIAGVASGLLFLFVFLITRGKGMGFGDVIYATFMGLLLGYPAIIIGLYLAFVSGALVSLFLVILKKKKLHGGTIPFGPFLVLGTFIMMIWKDELISLISRYVGLS